jgi:hypothetical protein
VLAVTKPALERLSRRLARKGAADDMALRFTRREGGWKLHLDHESDGDVAYTHDGRTVLLLDEGVSNEMANLTLDARKSGDGSRLRLRRRKRSGDR